MLNDLDGMTQSPNMDLARDFLARLRTWEAEQFADVGESWNYETDKIWKVLATCSVALGTDLIEETFLTIWEATKIVFATLEPFAVWSRAYLESNAMDAVTAAIIALVCRPFLDEDTYADLLRAVKLGDEGIGVFP